MSQSHGTPVTRHLGVRGRGIPQRGTAARGGHPGETAKAGHRLPLRSRHGEDGATRALAGPHSGAATARPLLGFESRACGRHAGPARARRAPPPVPRRQTPLAGPLRPAQASFRPGEYRGTVCASPALRQLLVAMLYCPPPLPVRPRRVSRPSAARIQLRPKLRPRVQ